MSREAEREPTQPTQSIFRRLGGQAFDLLTPRYSLLPATPKELALENANKLLDESRRAHLQANLFRIVGPSSPDNLERHTKLRNEFMAELAEKETIAERFNLFREPFYASFVNTLDIGVTNRPDSHDEVDALKEEYHALVRQLAQEGAIERDLPRAKAKPTIHLSFNSENKFVTATRNRDLFSYRDRSRTLSVAKRMTFLMPLEVVETFPVPAHGRLNVREVIEIEKLIDAQDADAIIPALTVYYGINKLDKPLENPKV